MLEFLRDGKFSFIGDHWLICSEFVKFIIGICLILFFSYFWVSVMFKPIQIADDLKKYGGYIPGVRPGEPTARRENLPRKSARQRGNLARQERELLHASGPLGNLLDVTRLQPGAVEGAAAALEAFVILDTGQPVELLRQVDDILAKVRRARAVLDKTPTE